MAHFRLYVDDSGTKEYAANPAAYTRTGNTRYFVFGALLVGEDSAAALAAEIANLKRSTFGTADVEVKSNWLRIPKERARHYAAPFGVSDPQLDGFVEAFYDVVAAAPVQLVAVVVDKVHMQEDYAPPKTPWYAPAVAYEVLLQRVVQEVRVPATVGVVIDDMTGATPRGNQYKRNLIGHHKRLRTVGSSLQRGIAFSSLVPGPRFLNSAQSHLIQVADTVSYNVLRQFTDHGDAWEDALIKILPTYSWFHRLGRKFRTDGEGRIQGFGIVKFPMRARIRWAYGKDEAAP
jgi:hypothetical protein